MRTPQAACRVLRDTFVQCTLSMLSDGAALLSIVMARNYRRAALAYAANNISLAIAKVAILSTVPCGLL